MAELSDRSLMVDPKNYCSGQCSTAGITKALVCASCLWDDIYKRRSPAANQNE